MCDDKLWDERRALRDFFAGVIREAFRHNDSIHEVTIGLLWAMNECHITKMDQRKAEQYLDL